MDILLPALLIIAVATVWLIYRKRSQPSLQPDNAPAIRLSGGNTFQFNAIGVSRYAPALEKIYGNEQPGTESKQVDAVLILENTHPSDKNAVRVEVQGRTVGYLPGDVAREYRRRLVDGGYIGARGICKAKIAVRLSHGAAASHDFSVRLDLPPKNAPGKQTTSAVAT